MPHDSLSLSRRSLLRFGIGALAASPALAASRALLRDPDPPFKISLAQWSLHRTLRAGSLDHLDFPRAASRDFGIHAVEYVNSFFKQGPNDAYVADLRKRCDDLGIKSLLIMCDGQGALGDPDENKRSAAIDNHSRWLHAAASLGCHSIRVNAHSQGSPAQQHHLAADGLRRLCERADPLKLNVIVENHGGLSSDGKWLAALIKLVNHPRAGTLPDFGNFSIDAATTYDRYKGVAELMPFAKGVSAKSFAFDDAGNETTIDFPRMMKIVADAGYRAHVGIEYEGDRHPEPDGIRLTKRLLERIRDDLAVAK